jgi:hypothetical protein
MKIMTENALEDGCGHNPLGAIRPVEREGRLSPRLLLAGAARRATEAAVGLLPASTLRAGQHQQQCLVHGRTVLIGREKGVRTIYP